MSGEILRNRSTAFAPSFAIFTSKSRLSRLSFTMRPRNGSSSTYRIFVLFSIVVKILPFGQPDSEYTSLAWFTYNFYQSAMTSHHTFHVAQTKTVTLDVMNIAGGHAEEFLEYLLSVFRGNADSPIGNF